MPVQDIMSDEWRGGPYSAAGAVGRGVQDINERMAKGDERKAKEKRAAAQETRSQEAHDVAKDTAAFEKGQREITADRETTIFERGGKTFDQAQEASKHALERRPILEEREDKTFKRQGDTFDLQIEVQNAELARLKRQAKVDGLNLRVAKNEVTSSDMKVAEEINVGIATNLDRLWRGLHTNEAVVGEALAPHISQWLELMGHPDAKGVDGVQVHVRDGKMVWVPMVGDETLKGPEGEDMTLDPEQLMRPAPTNKIRTSAYGSESVDPMSTMPGMGKKLQPGQQLSTREKKEASASLEKMITNDMRITSGKAKVFEDRQEEAGFYRMRAWQLFLKGDDMLMAYHKAQSEFGMKQERMKVEDGGKLDGAVSFFGSITGNHNIPDMADHIDSMFPDDSDGYQILAWIKKYTDLNDGVINDLIVEFERREIERNPDYKPASQGAPPGAPPAEAGAGGVPVAPGEPGAPTGGAPGSLAGGAPPIPEGMRENLRPGEVLMTDPKTGEFGGVPQQEVEALIAQGYQVIQ